MVPSVGYIKETRPFSKSDMKCCAFLRYSSMPSYMSSFSSSGIIVGLLVSSWIDFCLTIFWVLLDYLVRPNFISSSSTSLVGLYLMPIIEWFLVFFSCFSIKNMIRGFIASSLASFFLTFLMEKSQFDYSNSWTTLIFPLSQPKWRAVFPDGPLSASMAISGASKRSSTMLTRPLDAAICKDVMLSLPIIAVIIFGLTFMSNKR